jgi:hypothetical protein
LLEFLLTISKSVGQKLEGYNEKQRKMLPKPLKNAFGS